MKKLFIFDLDGVLVDSKEIHFNALNAALKEVDKKYIISKSEQKEKFEGLPTNKKLEMLSAEKGLPLDLHKKIFDLKQKQSILFFSQLQKDNSLIEIFNNLKKENIKVAVASNCIKETVEICLKSLGILEIVDLYLSNEDVGYPKPHPEIYIKCMNMFGVSPKETVIFEDSFIGKQAAFASGATIVSVDNRAALTEELILSPLSNQKKEINILIPMAGEGSRFQKAGFKDPKPFIKINNKPMIQVVHDNIGIDGKYIYVAKSEHVEKYNLEGCLKEFCKNFVIVEQQGRLEGATKSVLLAKDLIDNDSPLLIANSDQYIDWDPGVVEEFISSGVDGSILTFKSTESKWSYAEVRNEVVQEVFEKIVVGDNATVGIYFWKKGSDFVKYAEKMIEKNIRTNNEFYVCPVYNQAIQDGKIISISEVEKMQGLGTPEDLESYLESNNMFIDIRNRSYVNDVIEMNDHEICVQYKNPSYKIYDRSVKKTTEYIKYDYDAEMLKLPEAAGNLKELRPILRQVRWLFHPVVESIHTLDKVSFEDQSVYLAAYNQRFFHVALEILPKLFLLKKKDPNFKLILFGEEAIDANGDFVGFAKGHPLPKEKDGTYLKFWLDELEIDYTCVNIETLKDFNLNFRTSYVFYDSKAREQYEHINKNYSKLFFNGPYIYYKDKPFEPFCLLSREDSFIDIHTNTYLKQCINEHLGQKDLEANKKIFISRKNYVRRHPQENIIEEYLISKGYESVCMEDFNPIEQINIIRSATDVVSFLGSSLVNLYFVNKKINLFVISLDSDSDKNFNADMFKYYHEMIGPDNVKARYINASEEPDPTDYIIKEIEDFYGS